MLGISSRIHHMGGTPSPPDPVVRTEGPNTPTVVQEVSNCSVKKVTLAPCVVWPKLNGHKEKMKVTCHTDKHYHVGRELAWGGTIA